MCSEIGVSLARFRLASDRDEIEEKWNELSTYDVGKAELNLIFNFSELISDNKLIGKGILTLSICLFKLATI